MMNIYDYPLFSTEVYSWSHIFNPLKQNWHLYDKVMDHSSPTILKQNCHLFVWLYWNKTAICLYDSTETKLPFVYMTVLKQNCHLFVWLLKQNCHLFVWLYWNKIAICLYNCIETKLPFVCMTIETKLPFVCMTLLKQNFHLFVWLIWHKIAICLYDRLMDHTSHSFEDKLPFVYMVNTSSYFVSLLKINCHLFIWWIHHHALFLY